MIPLPSDRFTVAASSYDVESPEIEDTSSLVDTAAIPPTQEIDPSQINPRQVFTPCPAIYYDWVTQKPLRKCLFLTPLSLCSNPKQVEQSKRNLSSDERARALLPIATQKQAYQAEYPGYEIFFIKPEKIKGRIIINGLSADLFKAMFQRTPNQFLNDLGVFIEPKKTGTSPATSYDSKPTCSKIKISQNFSTSRSDAYAGVSNQLTGAFLTPLQSIRLEKQLKKFLQLLSYQFQSCRDGINPYDTLAIIFDVLGQTVIKDSPLLNGDEKVELSKRLFRHFEIFYWFFEQLLEKIAAKEFYSVSIQCRICITHMNRLIEIVGSQEAFAPLIAPLSAIQAPWKNLLEDLIKDCNDNYCTNLSAKIAPLLEKQICQLGDNYEIKAIITPSGLNEFLINRAHLLWIYLKQGVEHMKADEFAHSYLKGWEQTSEQFFIELSHGNWVKALNTINDLVQNIQQAIHICKTCNTIAAENSPDIWVQTFTPKSIKQFERYLSFAFVICENFIRFLNNRESSKRNNVASENIHHTYEQLSSIPPEVQHDEEFQPWLSKIKATAPPKFGVILKDYSRRLNRLNVIRETLKNNENLKTFIELSQQGCISLKTAEELCHELDPLVAEWIEHLININEHVVYLQNAYFGALFALETSEMPLELVRRKFLRMNERLKAIVKPTANFITAFEKYQRMDIFIVGVASSSNQEADQQSSTTVFSNSHGSITLSLFQTDLATFKDFDDQVKAFHEEVEQISISESLTTTSSEQYEEFIPSIPSSSQPSSSSSSSSSTSAFMDNLEEEFTAAFQDHTKRRKTMSRLNKLFKSYGVRDEVMITGTKGGHFILTIGKKRISFPGADFWKPGLKGELMRQSIEEVKRTLAKKLERAPS